ncbi:MAG: hypothetical protein HC844_12550 [Tabrizicola sp.]|nr:hypothetical protein [Tabrizicola sp.]
MLLTRQHSIFKDIVSALVAFALVLPNTAVADHVPDSLSQDIDPNYIACLMAVDDASPQFLGALQTTCFKRMVEICSGKNLDAIPSQVIDCISFESRRGANFLEAAVAELPEAVEKTGLFWKRYPSRLDGIRDDAKAVRSSSRPETVEDAIQQILPMAASATILFYLAKETRTSLENLVEATIEEH